jgi:hypothetical protein
MWLFTVLMCCIRSDASSLPARWPLIVSVAESTSGSEK